MAATGQVRRRFEMMGYSFIVAYNEKKQAHFIISSRGTLLKLLRNMTLTIGDKYGGDGPWLV